MANGLHALQSRAVGARHHAQSVGCATRLWRWGATEGGLLAQARSGKSWATGQMTLKWVFPKIGGKPPKWMVKTMENPIKMDDLGG